MPPAVGRVSWLPHRHVDQRADGVGRKPVINRWRIEELGGQAGPAAVTGNQREACRESTAGTFAEHPDSAGIDTVLGRGAAGRPLQCGIGVVERRRVGVFGRQPVGDGHHGDACLVGEHPRVVVDGVDRSRHVSASEQINQPRNRLARVGGRIHPPGHIGVTPVAGYDDVGDTEGAVRFVRRLMGRRLADEFACRCEIGEVELRESVRDSGKFGDETVSHGYLDW
jgi:hypothetical protein